MVGSAKGYNVANVLILRDNTLCLTNNSNCLKLTQPLYSRLFTPDNYRKLDPKDKDKRDAVWNVGEDLDCTVHDNGDVEGNSISKIIYIQGGPKKVYDVI